MPGSVDLAILGTLWLLVVVVMSAPLWVSVPAALTVYAVHSALLIRAEGLNPLTPVRARGGRRTSARRS